MFRSFKILYTPCHYSNKENKLYLKMKAGKLHKIFVKAAVYKQPFLKYENTKKKHNVDTQILYKMNLTDIRSAM